MQSYGFVPVIDKPTRVRNDSATLIDNILLNDVSDSIVSVPLFIASNVLPVNMLYYKTVPTLMRDVKNTMAPPNILNLFTSVRSMHTYHTRAATSDKLHRKYSRLKQQTDSFARVGVTIWNEIPVDIRELR